MKKKLLALCCAAMLAVLSACSLPSASDLHAISSDEFWYGLAEQGYDVEAYDATAAMAAGYGSNFTDRCPDFGYYFDEQAEFGVFNFEDNGTAAGYFTQMSDYFGDLCNAESSVTAGTVRMYSGTNRDDDLSCLLYKADNCVLMATSNYEGADRIREVAEYLMTTEFGELGSAQGPVESTDDTRGGFGALTGQEAPAPVGDEIEQSDFMSEVETTETQEPADSGSLSVAARTGQVYEIDWSDGTTLSIPTDPSWEVDDAYDYSLYVDAGDFSVSYSNSYCSTEDEVAQDLVEIYGCDIENCGQETYNGWPVYIGVKYDSLGYTFYVFQDVGREEFLFIRIDDYSDIPADEVIAQFLIP